MPDRRHHIIIVLKCVNDNVFFRYWDTQIPSWLFPNVRGRCLVFWQVCPQTSGQVCQGALGAAHAWSLNVTDGEPCLSRTPGPLFYLLITVTLLFDPRFGARSTEGPVPAGFFCPLDPKWASNRPCLEVNIDLTHLSFSGWWLCVYLFL